MNSVEFFEQFQSTPEGKKAIDKINAKKRDELERLESELDRVKTKIRADIKTAEGNCAAALAEKEAAEKVLKEKTVKHSELWHRFQYLQLDLAQNGGVAEIEKSIAKLRSDLQGAVSEKAMVAH